MIVGPDIDTPGSRCPHCKVKLDEAFGLDNEEKKISPGNVTLCIRCGEWSVYDEKLKLTKTDSKLLAEIKRDRNCQIAYHATMKLIRKRARQN